MRSNNKVRWAILGPGQIAHQFARDFNAVQNAELVGVASRDADRARGFASRYHIPYVFTYDELYASDLVDAVYIATPHHLHFEQSRECIMHGKAVLCEKPVTVNDHQFKKLAALAKEKQVFLMEALWTYFLPALHKAKKWIGDGRIGTMHLIQADFSFLSEFNPLDRIYNPLLAGGALLDIGIYPISLATFLMDRKPDDMKISAIFGPTKVDEFSGMIFTYGEVTAILFSSIRFNSRNIAIITGDKGSIEIPVFFKAETAHLYNAEHQLIESFNDQRTTLGYHYEIQEVTDCVLNRNLESSIVPHTRSNELQEIMTALRKQINLKYPME